MGGKLSALIWAVVGCGLLVGAVMLYTVQLIFALMAFSLAVGCFAMAAACLLKPAPERAAERDDDDARPQQRRRHWRP